MQSSTEALEDLVSRARRRSHRRVICLIFVGVTASLIGLAAAYWSYNASRQRAITAQRLAATEQQLTASTVAQQDAKTREQRVAALLADGVQQAHIGRFAAAEKAYEEVLQLDPKNSDALQFKGYLELRQGNIDESVRLLRMATSVAPGDPWAHYNLSLALFRSGDNAGAAEQIRELLQIAPGFKATILADVQIRVLRRQPEVKKLLEDTTG